MIATGCRVYASPTDAYALAGPAIVDLEDNILVLTSRELLLLEPVLSTRFDSNDESAGVRPSGYFHAEGPESSPGRLVGWFRPEAKLTTFDLVERVAPVASIGLRHEVVIPSIDGGAVGRICGKNCFADFRITSNGEPFLVEGLIRITGCESASEISDQAVAGAVVLTADKSALVGLVVGSIEGDLLIAPLDGILAAEGLRLASRAEIEEHNAEIEEAMAAASAGQPVAISSILEVLDGDDPNETVRAKIEAWAMEAWQRHLSGEKSSFAPFQDFFEDLEGGYEAFLQRLLDFGETYAQMQSREGTPDVASPLADRPAEAGPSEIEIVAGTEEDQLRAA
jgi:hypothetical protein